MGILPEMKTIRDLSGFEKQLSRGYRRDMVALFLLLALAALVVMTFAHRYGPWVDAASVEQIVAARNLAWGNGLTIPTAEGYEIPYGYQPPFYALLLSLVFLLRLDPFLMVIIFNIAVFAGTVFLLSWGLWRMTDSLLLALGIALLFAFTPHVLRNFDGASSLGLILFLAVANLIALIHYFQEESRRPYLLALFSATLAFFTGLIGGACIVAGAVTILIFSEKTFWRKLLHAGLYAFGAALPLIIWQVIHLLQPQTAAVRMTVVSVSVGEALTSYLQQLIHLSVQWLPAQPGWIQRWLQTRAALFGFAIVALGLYAVLTWRYVKNKDRIHRRWMILLTLCLLFVVSAAALLFGESYLQTRTAPALTMAMLAPLYPFVVIFVFGCMFALIASFRLPVTTLLLPVVVGGVFIMANLQPTLHYVYSRYQFGSTYTTPQWRSSEVLQIVNTTSALRTYFSNDPEAVLLYSFYAPYDIGDYDYSIPFLEQNPYLADQFLQWSGSLLLFQPSYLNPNAVESEPIDFSAFTQGMRQVYQGPDGEVYVPAIFEEGEK